MKAETVKKELDVVNVVTKVMTEEVSQNDAIDNDKLMTSIENDNPQWREVESLKSISNGMDNLMCNVCNKVFKNKRSLYSHKMEMHQSTPELHACPECGSNFGLKSNLRAHMRANCKANKLQPEDVKKPRCTNAQKQTKGHENNEHELPVLS